MKNMAPVFSLTLNKNLHDALVKICTRGSNPSFHSGNGSRYRDKYQRRPTFTDPICVYKLIETLFISKVVSWAERNLTLSPLLKRNIHRLSHIHCFGLRRRYMLMGVIFSVWTNSVTQLLLCQTFFSRLHLNCQKVKKKKKRRNN